MEQEVGEVIIYHGGNKKIHKQILEHTHISVVFVCSSSRRFVIRVIGAIHATQQPASANEEGGCATKGDAARHDKRRHDNQPANRGKREEMHQWTRGGGALIGRGFGGGRVDERTRGGEASTRQPASKRETTIMAVAKEKVTAMMVTDNQGRAICFLPC